MLVCWCSLAGTTACRTCSRYLEYYGPYIPVPGPTTPWPLPVAPQEWPKHPPIPVPPQVPVKSTEEIDVIKRSLAEIIERLKRLENDD
jgi:hypothetical protein